MPRALFALALLLLPLRPLMAAESLALSFGGKQHSYSAAELLARPDAQAINVPEDVSYRRPMTYRAVPLLGLLGNVTSSDDDTIEARAADGFVSQIPLQLIEKGAEGGSVAWVAVEDPAHPWPSLPGKDVSAGPFYVVWKDPQRSRVGTELWPYQTVALTGAESPAHRWPQMQVAADLPPEAPARHGQSVFTTQCMPCHRIKGAGAAEVGPDLGVPMNPTQYLTPQGLRALIRNPKSVRTWPQQQMPGFSDKALSDADLDAVIAYLTHMAQR